MFKYDSNTTSACIAMTAILHVI